jgi:thymidylate kinase
MHLIYIEGPDGSGKSTLTATLCKHLQGMEGFDTIRLKEPNDLIWGLRNLVLSPIHIIPAKGDRNEDSSDKLPAKVSLGITAASFAKSMDYARESERLSGKPLIVIMDRSIFSTYAYQSLANPDVAEERKSAFCEQISTVYDIVSSGVKAEHTIWLNASFGDTDPDVYSELGRSQEMQEAYKSLADAFTGDEETNPLTVAVKAVTKNSTVIENQELTIQETLTKALEAIDDVITRSKSGDSHSL